MYIQLDVDIGHTLPSQRWYR